MTNLTNLYVVRLWDGFDGEWMDVSEAVSKDEAQAIWNRETGNGTHHTKYDDIDYYKVFPADTKMFFSDGNSQTRGREVT